MKIQKWLLWIGLVAALLALAASSAAAELGGPVLPAGSLNALTGDMEEAETVTLYTMPEEETPATVEIDLPQARENGEAGAAPIVTVQMVGDFYTQATWYVTVIGATGPFTYDYHIVRPTVVNGQVVNYMFAEVLKSTNSYFAHTFQENGNYELWIQVYDAAGTYIAFKNEPVTVNTPGHDPLTATVSDVRGAYLLEPTSFGVTVTGGMAPYTYSYTLAQGTVQPGQSFPVVNQVKDSASNWYTYQIEANGTYTLVVDVKDAAGKTVRAMYAFTVNVPENSYLKVQLLENYSTRPVYWQAVVTGGTGSYTYHFELTETGTDFENDIVARTSGRQNENYFTYQFLSSGQYRITVNVRDSAGLERTVYKDIAKVSATTTASRRAAELMNVCRAAGNTTDYAMALWAHDWLMQNVQYDESAGHYGADGALLAGTGVSDSYAKAFYLMMKAVGVSCGRVVSDDASHAWNAVMLGGKWYMVDVTWDDGDENKHANGHFNCFITDEAARVDHPAYHSSYACTAVENNYYVREGYAGQWLSSMISNIETQLQQGVYRYAVLMPAYYTVENSNHFRNSPVAVIADTYLQQFIPYYKDNLRYQGQIVPLTFDVNRQSRQVSVSVNFDGKTLRLPARLRQIESQAFQNNAKALAVVIPNGATYIGPNAFTGCANLWKVVIPSSVVVISETAFQTNTGHLTVVAPAGSVGETFAIRNGLPHSAVE